MSNEINVIIEPVKPPIGPREKEFLEQQGSLAGAYAFALWNTPVGFPVEVPPALDERLARALRDDMLEARAPKTT